MKRTLARVGLLVAVCALAEAQDTSNRLVVPPRDTGGRLIEVTLVRASITVKTHAGKEVIIESRGTQTPMERDGMRRIDIPQFGGVTVQELGSVLRVLAPWRNGRQRDLTLTVPVESSLSLKTVMGDISVDGVHGEIDATTAHGSVTLTAVAGTVVASATLGPLKASLDRLDPTKPLSFSALNGNIDVTLPADVKANFKFRTDRGEVWSDFDVSITGKQVNGMHPLAGSGVYRTGGDRNIYATVNGGGVEVGFRTVNGKILIHKRK